MLECSLEQDCSRKTPQIASATNAACNSCVLDYTLFGIILAVWISGRGWHIPCFCRGPRAGASGELSSWSNTDLTKGRQVCRAFPWWARNYVLCFRFVFSRNEPIWGTYPPRDVCWKFRAKLSNSWLALDQYRVIWNAERCWNWIIRGSAVQSAILPHKGPKRPRRVFRDYNPNFCTRAVWDYFDPLSKKCECVCFFRQDFVFFLRPKDAYCDRDAPTIVCSLRLLTWGALY